MKKTVGDVQNGSRRLIYFDMLNIAACISVIFLHCNSMVHTFSYGKNWILALMIECLFYWAVPIFFMLTGATLMRYRDRYDTTTFFRRRLLRTAVPFVIWNAIWYLLLPNATDGLSIRGFISGMMSNQIVSVYWFFFPLFGIYLSLPALSWLADRRKTLWYLVIGSFVLQSVMPKLFTLLGLSWNGDLTIRVASGHIMFVLLGYLLSTTDIPVKQRRVIYLLGIFGLVFRFFWTLIVSERAGTLNRTFFDYLGFPSVLYAVAVFTWFKYFDFSPLEKKAKQIAKISSCSFGIYLIHRPLLQHIFFGIMGVSTTSLFARTIAPPIIYLCLLAMVYFMQRIPFVRRAVP